MIWRVTVAALLSASVADLHTPPGVQVSLCASMDRPPGDVARRLEPLGEAARTALLGLAQSAVTAEALCGVVGLTALGDVRVIPHMVAVLRNPAFRQETYRVARSAAYLAGGPDPDRGAAMVPVIEALLDAGVRDAAGDDALWLLGEVDHPSARRQLLMELNGASSDATLDAVVHALARQGDPGAQPRIASLGVEAVRAKSGNATPEQARRLGAVAFYQLALGPGTLADGLATLGTLALRDQADAASWAVHTLCARAVRRPMARAAIDAHRQVLVDALDRQGLSWSSVKGPFGCQASDRAARGGAH